MSPVSVPRGYAYQVGIKPARQWLELTGRMFPEPDRYLTDPVGWTHQQRKVVTYSKQDLVMAAVAAHRHVNVRAAHGTGKSWTAANLVCWWLDTRPVGSAFVVTSAPTAAQIDAILWREIGAAHSKMSLPGSVTHSGYPKWMIGKELVAYGRKPTDYVDPTKAMQSFQGIHAKYVLVVLDEACGIPKWLWDAAETLATNEYSRILAIGNPDDPASQFAQMASPGSGWVSMKISAWDLPWATGEIVPQSLSDVLTSETWVIERERGWGLGSPMYTSKIDGEFPPIADDTLISPKLVREAQERELAGVEQGQFGADIARKGKDESVVYWNRGGRIRLLHRHAKKDTMETSGLFGNILRAHPAIPMHLDMIGLGAGVFDRLRELNLRVAGFDANGAAYDPNRFINRRAESFWDLREMMEEGLIDLDPKDDMLASQLQSIKWKVDSRGRIGIEAKEDMAKRGLPSPDRADAVMYATSQISSIALGNEGLEDDGSGSGPSGLTDDLLMRRM